MAAVSALENNHNAATREKTFDLDFTMNVLGCSMPFSVILILLIYSSGTIFTDTYSVFTVAAAFLMVAFVPAFILALRTQTYANDNPGAL